MKGLFSVLVIFGLTFSAAAVHAAGGCPDAANSLQEYQHCLAQVPGGAVYRGTMANLDQDHQELLAAMHQNPGVPPQVMPTHVPAYYGYGYYPALYRMAPTLSNAFGFVSWSIVGAAAANRGNWAPYYWMTAGFPIY